MQIKIPLIDRLIILALTWIAFMKLEFTVLSHTLTHTPSIILLVLLYQHCVLMQHQPLPFSSTQQETSGQETAVSQPVSAKTFHPLGLIFLVKSTFFLLCLRAGTDHLLCSAH